MGLHVTRSGRFCNAISVEKTFRCHLHSLQSDERAPFLRRQVTSLFDIENDVNLPASDFNMINQPIVDGELGDHEGNLICDGRLRGDVMAAQLIEEQFSIKNCLLFRMRTQIKNANDFFLYDPVETGKKLLYNTVIHVLNGQGKKTIAVVLLFYKRFRCVTRKKVIKEILKREPN